MNDKQQLNHRRLDPNAVEATIAQAWQEQLELATRTPALAVSASSRRAAQAATTSKALAKKR